MAVAPYEPRGSEPSLPASVEAEAALLGALMMDNKLVDTIADTLRADDFFESVHGRIFTAIVETAALGRAANSVTLRPLLEGDPGIAELGGPGYLAKLTANGLALMGARDFARQIAEMSKRRRLIAEIDEARAGLFDTAAGDVDEIAAQLDAALGASADGSDGVIDMTGAQCIDAVFADQEDTSKGVRCNALGRLCNLTGELKSGDFAVIAGRPSMGKTMTGVTYAVGAARAGYGTLFVTLEMSALQIGQRMASDAAFDGEVGVPFAAITKRSLNSFDRRTLDQVRAEMDALPVRVVDTTGLRVGRLAGLIRRQKRRFAAKGKKLDLVVVDYLQLLHPDTKGGSVYEAMSEVSRACKAMAKREGVALVALAQLSRSVEQREDKRPRMSDLRDTGQIEQDADVIVLLFRPEYYLSQAEPGATDAGREKWEAAMEAARGKIEFIVPKCRNGVAGSAMGQFHGQYQAVRG